MRRADVSARALEALARGDAFASLGLDRRAALWEVRALAGRRWQELPLFAHATRRHHDIAGAEPQVALPRAQLGEEVAADYRSLGLSLKAHPVRLLEPRLAADGWQTCAVAHEAPDGRRLRLAGLVTMRQRPGTAKGTVFLTLEDGLLFAECDHLAEADRDLSRPDAALADSGCRRPYPAREGGASFHRRVAVQPERLSPLS